MTCFVKLASWTVLGLLILSGDPYMSLLCWFRAPKTLVTIDWIAGKGQ